MKQAVKSYLRRGRSLFSFSLKVKKALNNLSVSIVYENVTFVVLEGVDHALSFQRWPKKPGRSGFFPFWDGLWPKNGVGSGFFE